MTFRVYFITHLTRHICIYLHAYVQSAWHDVRPASFAVLLVAASSCLQDARCVSPHFGRAIWLVTHLRWLRWLRCTFPQCAHHTAQPCSNLLGLQAQEHARAHTHPLRSALRVRARAIPFGAIVKPGKCVHGERLTAPCNIYFQHSENIGKHAARARSGCARNA